MCFDNGVEVPADICVQGVGEGKFQDIIISRVDPKGPLELLVTPLRSADHVMVSLRVIFFKLVDRNILYIWFVLLSKFSNKPQLNRS